ncbi:hypothetical protein BDB00DRAFT_786343 [Zychaea mexicana]|uniref:uncharacterized protein n=1 Tax=Zychaea mexicana TaxID=64656 RepID=UPI0022FE2D35|nr:uncharacterized protein BDB00DRAFT_786343 [Zychaea mexicana]KAI9495546.1 hypothetical protein BDB00DRAFT_786343 [Zychaea mexicana]
MDAALQRAPGHRVVVFNAFFFKLSLVGPCIVELEELKTSERGYRVSQVTLKQLPTPAPLDEPSPSAYDPSAYITKLHIIITTTNKQDGFKFAPLDYKQTPPVFDGMKLSKFGLAGGPDVLRIYENQEHGDKGELWHAFEWPNDREPIDAKSIACFADIATSPRPFITKEMMHAIRASLQFEIAFHRPPTNPTKRVLVKFLMKNIIDGIMNADAWLYDQDGYLLATARHHIAFSEKKPKKPSL